MLCYCSWTDPSTIAYGNPIFRRVHRGMVRTPAVDLTTVWRQDLTLRSLLGRATHQKVAQDRPRSGRGGSQNRLRHSFLMAFGKVQIAGHRAGAQFLGVRVMKLKHLTSMMLFAVAACAALDDSTTSRSNRQIWPTFFTSERKSCSHPPCGWSRVRCVVFSLSSAEGQSWRWSGKGDFGVDFVQIATPRTGECGAGRIGASLLPDLIRLSNGDPNL